MNQVSSALDAEWREAIDAASPPDRPDLSVFVEERHDLVVEADSRSSGVEALATRSGGLNVSELHVDGRSLYLARARPEDLRHCLDTLARGGALPNPGSRERAEEPGEVDTAAPAGFVEKALKRMALQLPGVRTRVRWVGFRQQVWVNGRHGTAGETRRASRLRIEADVGPGVPLTAELALKIGRSGDDSALESAIAAMAERAGPFRTPTTGCSGEFEVVLGPGVGGILAHELVGHALEADTVLDERSWLTQFEENRISETLTVLDDPRRGRAPWQVDDEGESAVPTALLREGRIVDWLHDLRSAARCNRSSNGHGRRASFREPVRPRMGCTFIANGRFQAGELLEGIDDGIYVRRMESASTDTTTGRASFRIGDADRIVNGRIERALRPHLMIVEGSETLTRLDQIGNDLAFDTCIGSCHRDGQPLAVSVGAPTICLGLVKLVF